MKNSIDVLSGNKLIADFMGYEYISYNNGNNPPYGWWKKNLPIRNQIIPKTTLGRKHIDLKYHCSWDWLMSVIQKIGKLDSENIKGLREYMSDKFIDSKGCQINIYSSKIDIFNAVVDFIIWYNHNNSTDEFEQIGFGGNKM